MKISLLLPGLVLALATPAPAILGLFGGDDEPQEAPAPADRAQQQQVGEATNAQALAAQQAGNLGEAGDLYERVATEFPFTEAAGEARYQLGRIAEARGRHEDAIESYQSVIERYPNSPRFGDALSSQFQLAELARTGEIRTSFLGIARDYDDQDVMAWYQNVVNAAPRSDLAPASLYALGLLHAERGERNQATEVLERLVRDYPDSDIAPEAQLALSEVIAGGSGGRTGEVSTLARQREALEDFQTLYEDSDLAPEAQERLGTVQSRQATNDLNIAQFYEDRGNLRAASIYYREVLRYEGTAEYEVASQRLAEMGISDGPIGEDVDAQLSALAAEGRMLTSRRPDYAGPPAPDLGAADGGGVMRLDSDLLEFEDDLPTDLPEGLAPGEGLFDDDFDDLGELPDLQTGDDTAESTGPEDTQEDELDDARDALERAREAVEEMRRRNAEREAAEAGAVETAPETGAGGDAATAVEDAVEEAAEDAAE